MYTVFHIYFENTLDEIYQISYQIYSCKMLIMQWINDFATVCVSFK